MTLKLDSYDALFHRQDDERPIELSAADDDYDFSDEFLRSVGVDVESDGPTPLLPDLLSPAFHDFPSYPSQSNVDDNVFDLIDQTTEPYQEPQQPNPFPP